VDPNETRDQIYTEADLQVYATLLTLVRFSTHPDELANNPNLLVALGRLGIEPTAEVFPLLLQLRNSQPCPLHLGLLRRLAHSPEMVQRLGGVVLSEFHLDLSNFSEVFARLTPSFFRDQCGPGTDETVVWYAARALDQAIGSGREVEDITALHQLLRVASK